MSRLHFCLQLALAEHAVSLEPIVVMTAQAMSLEVPCGTQVVCLRSCRHCPGRFQSPSLRRQVLRVWKGMLVVMA